MGERPLYSKLCRLWSDNRAGSERAVEDPNELDNGCNFSTSSQSNGKDDVCGSCMKYEYDSSAVKKHNVC